VTIRLEHAHRNALDGRTRREIVALCVAAYNEDFSRLFEEFTNTTHVLARDAEDVLVSHAMWVTRWLQPEGHPLLRTAYVEAVATLPDRQRQGHATKVMEHVVETIRADLAWELAALSPAVPDFYRRQGWEPWLGPLAIRCLDGSIEPTPAGELVLIRRLPRTPVTIASTSLLTAEWRAGELW
jgi:aminoglycoside 2'-N-acetyltransferase I